MQQPVGADFSCVALFTSGSRPSLNAGIRHTRHRAVALPLRGPASDQACHRQYQAQWRRKPFLAKCVLCCEHNRRRDAILIGYRPVPFQLCEGQGRNSRGSGPEGVADQRGDVQGRRPVERLREFAASRDSGGRGGKRRQRSEVSHEQSPRQEVGRVSHEALDRTRAVVEEGISCPAGGSCSCGSPSLSRR